MKKIMNDSGGACAAAVRRVCGGKRSACAHSAKGEIVVATEGAWAPWTYHDENDQLVGFELEVARASRRSWA